MIAAHNRIPKGMPSPMPTLAAPLSPADPEDGGIELLEGATVAGV